MQHDAPSLPKTLKQNSPHLFSREKYFQQKDVSTGFQRPIFQETRTIPTTKLSVSTGIDVGQQKLVPNLRKLNTTGFGLSDDPQDGKKTQY